MWCRFHLTRKVHARARNALDERGRVGDVIWKSLWMVEDVAIHDRDEVEQGLIEDVIVF